MTTFAAAIAALLLLGAIGLYSPAAAGDNVIARSNLVNSRIQFEREKTGRVAFLGGSITEMDGYRPLVCQSLLKRFSRAEFTFINAGIASTCSTTGAFRLHDDVLSHGPIDLLFVEFAVNDDQDAAHNERDCIRGMEGIVRQARIANPHIDVVITHFVNPAMLQTIQDGKTPLTVAAHEQVAEHYGISTIHLAREVAQRISARRLTWDEYGGTHPAPAGNQICADLIDRLLDDKWSVPLAAGALRNPHPLPERPLDENSYFNGRFIDPANAQLAGGWKLHVPPWSELPGQQRERFTSLSLLCADEPGAELSLQFEGRAIGAYVLAGPDASVLQASIDGGPFRPIDLFHRFSRGLHYPRTVMFAADLEPGPHKLVLRTTKRDGEQGGTAARIMQFTAN